MFRCKDASHTHIKTRDIFYNLLTVKGRERQTTTQHESRANQRGHICDVTHPFNLAGASFLEEHNQLCICNLHRSTFRERERGQCVFTAPGGTFAVQRVYVHYVQYSASRAKTCLHIKRLGKKLKGVFTSFCDTQEFKLVKQSTFHRSHKGVGAPGGHRGPASLLAVLQKSEDWYRAAFRQGGS